MSQLSKAAEGRFVIEDWENYGHYYVPTLQAWYDRFEQHLPQLTALVGEEVVRVWRLYLVGGALAFEEGRMGVDQILAVRPGEAHTLDPVRSW